MTSSDADREGFAALLLRLRGVGVVDQRLLSALEATPRRDFVSAQWQDQAWQDGMLPIACGEAMEGIDLQAMVLAALDLQPGCRVLEVGTGTGFTSAVMGRLVGRVISMDRFKTLVDDASRRVAALGLDNIVIRQADASNGLPAEGPFDRIVVWGSFETLPRTFVDQLTSGGSMIAPIGPADGAQAMAKLSKLGSRFDREDIARVRLQPLTPGVALRL